MFLCYTKLIFFNIHLKDFWCIRYWYLSIVYGIYSVYNIDTALLVTHGCPFGSLVVMLLSSVRMVVFLSSVRVVLCWVSQMAEESDMSKKDSNYN